MHEVLFNRLGGLRKGVVRLTDRPDMTLDVYRDVKQQHNKPTTSVQILFFVYMSTVLCQALFISQSHLLRDISNLR